ncbi:MULTISPECIES: pseudaminic acid synthase [Rheinheimera]|uniref:pseudaminic acid synthase n=1 Tax=Rheinheimera TaxID=67575 RepID=UPI000E83CD02|nr:MULTISPECIES: pseudaminic acid synthase [Rheinheimera]MCD1599755.1 pseudaminic acid synthase [Rheinheimera aquimaris]HBN89809.1 pseudaminic acid synthase [Rheinheimera sp.]
MATIKLGQRAIGPGEAPFIIAELSGNHDQSLDKALAMVDAAAACGADAIKIQTYTADSMTLDIRSGDFVIQDPGNLWQGKSLYELYQLAMTPWDWHQAIFERANALGMLAFSTPFDLAAVEFLEQLNVPCYKIASFENSDHALLAAVARTGKPVIMSTGMATQTELAESVEVLKKNGCQQMILLKCTSHYPADPVDANLATIPHLAQLFDCQVGLSDHTAGIGVAVASVVLGASVIEKHFVLDRSEGGVDAEFSLQPEEFSALVQECKRAAVALGKVTYGGTAKEQASRKYRRSLYIAADMQPGDIFTSANLRSVRPGLGLETKYLPMLLGKPIKKAASKGTPMSWELL